MCMNRQTRTPRCLGSSSAPMPPDRALQGGFGAGCDTVVNATFYMSHKKWIKSVWISAEADEPCKFWSSPLNLMNHISAWSGTCCVALLWFQHFLCLLLRASTSGILKTVRSSFIQMVQTLRGLAGMSAAIVNTISWQWKCDVRVCVRVLTSSTIHE